MVLGEQLLLLRHHHGAPAACHFHFRSPFGIAFITYMKEKGRIETRGPFHHGGLHSELLQRPPRDEGDNTSGDGWFPGSSSSPASPDLLPGSQAGRPHPPSPPGQPGLRHLRGELCAGEVTRPCRGPRCS